MRIAVINFSGNVGKTTVARHLLAPRLDEPTLITVESLNADAGRVGEAIRGRQFGELQEALLLLEEAVVDVGASNVEDFVELMRQYRGSHEDFDYLVVPTVPEAKPQRDTVSTLAALAELGVPPERLRLLFNKLPSDETPQRVFAGLFDYHAATRNFTLRPAAVLHVNEIYAKLEATPHAIRALLAAGVAEELDTAFAALFA